MQQPSHFSPEDDPTPSGWDPRNNLLAHLPQVFAEQIREHPLKLFSTMLPFGSLKVGPGVTEQAYKAAILELDSVVGVVESGVYVAADVQRIFDALGMLRDLRFDTDVEELAVRTADYFGLCEPTRAGLLLMGAEAALYREAFDAAADLLYEVGDQMQRGSLVDWQGWLDRPTSLDESANGRAGVPCGRRGVERALDLTLQTLVRSAAEPRRVMDVLVATGRTLTRCLGEIKVQEGTPPERCRAALWQELFSEKPAGCIALLLESPEKFHRHLGGDVSRSLWAALRLLQCDCPPAACFELCQSLAAEPHPATVAQETALTLAVVSRVAFDLDQPVYGNYLAERSLDLISGRPADARTVFGAAEVLRTIPPSHGSRAALELGDSVHAALIRTECTAPFAIEAQCSLMAWRIAVHLARHSPSAHIGKEVDQYAYVVGKYRMGSLRTFSEIVRTADQLSKQGLLGPAEKLIEAGLAAFEGYSIRRGELRHQLGLLYRVAGEGDRACRAFEDADVLGTLPSTRILSRVQAAQAALDLEGALAANAELGTLANSDQPESVRRRADALGEQLRVWELLSTGQPIHVAEHRSRAHLALRLVERAAAFGDGAAVRSGLKAITGELLDCFESRAMQADDIVPLLATVRSLATQHLDSVFVHWVEKSCRTKGVPLPAEPTACTFLRSTQVHTFRGDSRPLFKAIRRYLRSPEIEEAPLHVVAHLEYLQGYEYLERGRFEKALRSFGNARDRMALLRPRLTLDRLKPEMGLAAALARRNSRGDLARSERTVRAIADSLERTSGFEQRVAFLRVAATVGQLGEFPLPLRREFLDRALRHAQPADSRDHEARAVAQCVFARCELESGRRHSGLRAAHEAIALVRTLSPDALSTLTAFHSAAIVLLAAADGVEERLQRITLRRALSAARSGIVVGRVLQQRSGEREPMRTVIRELKELRGRARERLRLLG